MSAAFGRSDAVADCRSRRSACWVPGRMFRDCSSPPISWFTPARNEAAGNVLLEGIASGLPVICSSSVRILRFCRGGGGRRRSGTVERQSVSAVADGDARPPRRVSGADHLTWRRTEFLLSGRGLPSTCWRSSSGIGQVRDVRRKGNRMRVLMLGKQSSWMGLHLSHIEAAFRRRGHEIAVGDYHRMASFCGISLPRHNGR